MQVIEMLSEELHVNGDGCRPISEVLKPNTRRRYSFGGRRRIFHSEDPWDRRIGKIGGILPRRYGVYAARLHSLRRSQIPVDGIFQDEDETGEDPVNRTEDPLPDWGSLKRINAGLEPATIGSKLPPSLLSAIERSING